MHRRAVLASVATLPLAGCLGGSDDGSASAGDDGGQRGGDHPARQGLSDYPYLGDAPADAGRLIVAFEDPGCPNCASFHRSRLPDVRSELIDGGDATLVWRPMRYATSTSPWNEQAIHAVLEATARDVDAAWSLLAFYYERQDGLTLDDVVAETEAFVAEETDLAADPVVDAMAESAHDDLLSDSEAAAEQSNVTSTPSFVLFDGDEHATTIRTSSPSVTEFRAGFEA